LKHGAESGSGKGDSAYPGISESGVNSAAARISDKLHHALSEEAGGLLELQSRFIQHYFHLLAAEQGLSHRAAFVHRGMAGGAIRQIELERQRLGRELHTGVGQLLAAIRLQLEVANSQLVAPPEGVVVALERIATLAADALEQIRAVSHRLHPPEWQRLTLEAAVLQLWEYSGIPERLEATLKIEPLAREPEQEVKVLIYRGVQEALANLVRHAQATRISLTLEERGDQVILTMVDNGRGFDVAKLLAAPASVASGIGLRSLREQAAGLGGKLEITSGPEGTKLELSAPFAAPEI
jgi:two-component system, NarL family, sensor kinase